MDWILPKQIIKSLNLIESGALDYLDLPFDSKTKAWAGYFALTILLMEKASINADNFLTSYLSSRIDFMNKENKIMISIASHIKPQGIPVNKAPFGWLSKPQECMVTVEGFLNEHINEYKEIFKPESKDINIVKEGYYPVRMFFIDNPPILDDGKAFVGYQELIDSVKKILPVALERQLLLTTDKKVKRNRNVRKI